MSTATIPLGTFAERAWYAYHCLPRGRRGKPPSIDSLLGRPRRAMLTRLFRGERTDPRHATREILAEVLKVPPECLDYGKGDPPTLTGPYKCNIDLCLDKNADWARRFEAIGVEEDSVNNFALAALWYRERLSTAAIEEVAAQAKGQENRVTREEWARRLRAAHVRLGGSGFDLYEPSSTAAISSDDGA